MKSAEIVRNISLVGLFAFFGLAISFSHPIFELLLAYVAGMLAGVSLVNILKAKRGK